MIASESLSSSTNNKQNNNKQLEEGAMELRVATSSSTILSSAQSSTFPSTVENQVTTCENNIMSVMETSNTNQPVRNVLQLSQQHHVLLIFRRFVSYGGCAFCNRRTLELLQFYRSLTQMNIVPVVVYPESKEKGEKFFQSLEVPELVQMLRVADPDSEFASSFQVHTDPFSKKEILTYLLPQLIIAKVEGFSQEIHKRQHYEGKSFDIKPTLFLLREGKIVYEWRLNYADHCTEIINDIVLLLDVNNGVSEKILKEENNDMDHEEKNRSTLSITQETLSMETSLKPSEETLTKLPRDVNESSQALVTLHDDETTTRCVEDNTLSKVQELPPSSSSTHQTSNNESSVEGNLKEQPSSSGSLSETLHMQPAQTEKAIPSSIVDPLPLIQSEYIFVVKDVPKYRRIPSTPLVQVMSAEMKEQEEYEKTERAKRMLQQRVPSHNGSSSSDSHGRHRCNHGPIRISCICSFDSVDVDSTIDLFSVLNDSKKRRYFKLFSHYEYNSENLIFWEEVYVNYKPNAYIGKYEKVKKLAFAICQQFLFDSSSIMYINTKDKLREEVKSNLKRLFCYSNKNEVKLMPWEEQIKFNEQAPLLFDNILNELMTTVLPDMFVRFKMSPLFSEMENHKTHP
ncbi:hypothetical protein C9374_003620 [Naegleria lovaniensis]|uniref:RGS domain-containing protein n=1 Tax=Naegleria lovaniensis TaxID=51637 RepID=A0AA88H540_NAELO|nr:uncharacterized protein C9374_003620 [Naegleria lovaniensis]KAG2393856.1 hypothetical protein C9374_003620 [Naegleria lovaniensis]